jgi:AraC-like DNA-binding protein
VPKEVIVVGPVEVWRTIVHSVDGNCRVVAFTTLEELDRWRENQGFDDPSIYPDLVVALMEAGCRLGSLPRRLRKLIESIGEQTYVPRLREVENRWPSRSSFYRVWHQQIEPGPATFLRHVRALHARRLMANGRTKKEAALLAGYSSVDQMRRNINEEV